MDIKLQKYYEDRLSMMGDTAWKDLIEDVNEMIKSTNDITSIQDEKALHFKRGELSIMNWLVNLHESSSLAYEHLKGEE
jgi:hypothetical protein